MIDIIDVTLRDGGHAIKFDWPLDMAKEYYQIISDISDVKMIELGYWGQTAKSKNMFYDLDLEKVSQVTQSSNRNNVSVMIDYHYCSKDFNQYPDASQKEVSMIRVCSRKGDIDDALVFAQRLKDETGILVSFNIFNFSNYSEDEIVPILEKVSSTNLDYVYFADTHGCLDFGEDKEFLERCVKILTSSGIKAGMHLHDHSGKAYYNYRMLDAIGFTSTDASTRGMGKGVGNLKLEHIISKNSIDGVLDFVFRNESLLTMRESPYGLITAKHSLTDYYGLRAEELGISLSDFDLICSNIHGVDKDVYNEECL